MNILSPVEVLEVTEFLTAAAVSEDAPVILIAEDNQDNRLMMKFLLENWNYLVIEAENGEDAVTIAENKRPDLILLDVKMPGLDGFEVTRRIRRSDKISDTPIIFVSGCGEVFYRHEANSAGGNDFLTKPVDFDELRSALGKYL